MLIEKIREDRQRRRLAAQGYALRNTPARSWLRQEYGAGYQIEQGNIVVDGCGSRQYMLTLDEVEAWRPKRAAA